MTHLDIFELIVISLSTKLITLLDMVLWGFTMWVTLLKKGQKDATSIVLIPYLNISVEISI